MEPLALFTYSCTENSHCKKNVHIDFKWTGHLAWETQICYIEDNQLFLKAYIAHISQYCFGFHRAWVCFLNLLIDSYVSVSCILSFLS